MKVGSTGTVWLLCRTSGETPPPKDEFVMTPVCVWGVYSDYDTAYKGLDTVKAHYPSYRKSFFIEEHTTTGPVEDDK